jgi:hypothetical protein
LNLFANYTYRDLQCFLLAIGARLMFALIIPLT